MSTPDPPGQAQKKLHLYYRCSTQDEKKSRPDDMCVRPGHIQGNGAQGVWGPPGGPCAVLHPILSKRGI